MVAALATNIYGVLLGRALQGCGAISAAVMALLADLTQEVHRTKAMATIGAWIVETYHLQSAFHMFEEGFRRWGMWIILAKGLTPIPFILVSVASGMSHFNLAVFIVSASITRGARFFLEAFLIRRFGQPVQNFIERYMTWIGLGVLALIVGAVWLVVH